LNHTTVTVTSKSRLKFGKINRLRGGDLGKTSELSYVRK